MSHFGGGLHLWGPAGLGADGVGIPSNLLISSGCLCLSGLNLTDCACGGGPAGPWAPLCEGTPLRGGGGGGGLLGLGSLVRGAGVHGG